MGDNNNWFSENTGGVIAAAGSILGQGIGAVSQGSMNKKTRDWNEKMYGQQRENALADWNAQNAYNSPEQQMARLRAAGLNPNLVYGNGATATSSAMPRPTEPKNWDPKAPLTNLDTGQVMSSYYDTQIKKQTLTNMDAQEKVLRQEALAKAAETIGRGISNARGSLQYDIEQATRENVISRSGLQNDLIVSQRNKTDWDTEFTQKSLQRQVEQIALIKSQTAESKGRRMLLLANVQNAIKDGKLKDFEIRLNDKGITRNDPIYMRMLDTLVEELMNWYNE